MAKRILVVVDMQRDFTTGVLGNQECAEAVSGVVDVIRTGKYDTVAATRDTHGEDYLSTNEGKNLPVVHCIRDTEGWEIVPEVAAALKEAAKGRAVEIFDKPTFGSVKLAEYLQKQYLEDSDLQVDFVGVCTGICVISNVALAKAYCPEAQIRVIAAACACVTPDSHRTALDAMRTFQVAIV